MPQVFQVLRCYKCFVFQVHQVKKSNKWECKLCGEKQSIKRHYGTGTGKKCRLHVQKLNELRGEIDKQDLSYVENDDDIDNTEDINDNSEQEPRRKSKWSNYVEENSEATNIPSGDGGKETLFEKTFVLQIFKKRKNEFTKNMRKRNIAFKKNKYKQVSDEDNVCSPVGESAAFHDTASTQKKLIKFNPPAIKVKSKWTEYNEDEYFSNSTEMSDSDFSLINNEKEPNSWDVLCANRYKTDNFKIDTSATVSSTHQKTIESDKGKHMNFHKSVGVANKLTSKWNEFVDNTECSQDYKYSPLAETVSVKPSNLFALCDDNELDSVLNI